MGEQRFRLHRALLWARSAWFRVLLDDKWDGVKRTIEVRSLTATVFGAVVEYLYTGYVAVLV